MSNQKMPTTTDTDIVRVAEAAISAKTKELITTNSDDEQNVSGEETPVNEVLPLEVVSTANTTTTATTTTTTTTLAVTTTPLNKKFLVYRRIKDSSGLLQNFSSLPLFVYATSSTTHATSADGVGVSKEAVSTNSQNEFYDLTLCKPDSNGVDTIVGAMNCLPPLTTGGSTTTSNNNNNNNSTHHHILAPNALSSAMAATPGASTTVVVATTGGVPYQHHLNLNHHHHHHLLNHQSPYSNNYPLHHSSSHHHIHSDHQTKSLQELQHEVGALLEFRDLVIETFPDLKHKMASISSASALSSAATQAAAAAAAVAATTSISGTNTLTGVMSNSSLVSRREWEPGIRIKRKLSQKEPSTSSSASTSASTATAGASGTSGVVTVAGELSSSSLTRSRSNSHSGKKEPKSGENNNGSVVQDSGFSTETSSSKEGHSASSTNGAMTGPIPSNRLSCLESDDELLNLLDVIHRKSNRLREEMEQLQNYERQNLRGATTGSNSEDATTMAVSASTSGVTLAAATTSSNGANTMSGLTPKTFREHVERLNKEDIKQLRIERDRLLDKLAEMEAETLTGRIKAAKMSDQVEELINVKKSLEEQLKLAMAQKLELSSRVQQLQQQQQLLQSKSSSSQSDYSSQRNFLSSATTVLSTGSGSSHSECNNTTVPSLNRSSNRQNTFQPVVVEQQQQQQDEASTHFAFHQSVGGDSKQQGQQRLQLGRLDGIVSTPGGRNTKVRTTNSERIAAILLETSVVELQRHLLTLTVQNQALMQKLEQSTKSKTHLAKRLDKSKDDVEDLRFQLEEKNIELEGTKAQLRVLESRIHSSTPSSGALTHSYLHSQNDYETNRSSASTTLMLSRRGLSGGSDSHNSDLISGPSMSQHSGQMPPPPVTQISTPSMKAMVPLAIDEIQQHCSSTESAHDHEVQNEPPVHTTVGRLMSTSVGGISPFEQQQIMSRGQTGGKKSSVYNTAASKPSKIPLPGSKTASYFAGKPPTGRPSTAGRSPPSTNTSTGSNTSSKSSLSRSTGNLLYSKSPNSLKRADSAQSIRKDASSSLSTNTSRSSTSSSIPLSTTPYSMTKSHGIATTNPSQRVLQNSPLPKLKRESLTSRMRHLDSLSRAHNSNRGSNLTSASSPTSATTPSAAGGIGSYIVSSTPKPSAIAAHLNSTLRKDLQLSSSNSFSHGSSQPFLRRATGGSTTTVTTSPSSNTTSTTRRFSSASAALTSRLNGRHHMEHSNGGGDTTNTTVHHNAISGGSSGGGGGNITAGGNHNSQQHNTGTSDSDSGKNFIISHKCNQPNHNQNHNPQFYSNNNNNKNNKNTNIPISTSNNKVMPSLQPPIIKSQAQTALQSSPPTSPSQVYDETSFDCKNICHSTIKQSLNNYERHDVGGISICNSKNDARNNHLESNKNTNRMQKFQQNSQFIWNNQEHTFSNPTRNNMQTLMTTTEQQKAKEKCLIYEDDDDGPEPYYSHYSFNSYSIDDDDYDNDIVDHDADEGSDHLLVTIDYGYNDSIEESLTDEEDTNSIEEKVLLNSDDKVINRKVYTIKEEDEPDNYISETNMDSVINNTDDNYDDIDCGIRKDDDGENDEPIWFYASDLKAHDYDNIAEAFQVHHVEHPLKDTIMSLEASYSEYDVDDTCSNDDDDDDDVIIANNNRNNYYKINYQFDIDEPTTVDSYDNIESI